MVRDIDIINLNLKSKIKRVHDLRIFTLKKRED